jgi:DNA-binding transcriptional regulator YdaS (Cro superfamily)
MNIVKAKEKALDKAIKFFGSQGKLANAVGVKQPSIAGAKLRGQASESLAKKIHAATRGAVPKWELRPDLFEAA